MSPALSKIKDKRPLVITLVNAWSDDNKGDLGIAEGTIALLRKTFPDCVINVVSLLDRPPLENHRALAQFAPQVTPLTSLYHKKIAFPFQLLRDWWGPKNPGRNHSIQMLAGSDLVIGLGGHHFVTNGWLNFRNYLHFLFVLSPFILAKKFGIPFVLLGHSFGPIEILFSKKTFQAVMRQAQYIGLREGLSRTWLLNHIFTGTAVYPPSEVIPDLAFYLSPLKTKRVTSLLVKHRLKKGSFWVITIRKWGDARQRGVYVEKMAQLIRLILGAGLTKKILLVNQSLGPLPSEDDRDITAQLLKKAGDLPVEAVSESLDPGEYMEIYRKAGLLLGTRFHSIIFALNAGTPVFAISYFGPKAFGIMKMLGLDNYCVDISLFDPEKVFEDLSAMNLGDLRRRIPKKIRKLKALQLKIIPLRLRRALKP